MFSPLETKTHLVQIIPNITLAINNCLIHKVNKIIIIIFAF